MIGWGSLGFSIMFLYSSYHIVLLWPFAMYHRKVQHMKMTWKISWVFSIQTFHLLRLSSVLVQLPLTSLTVGLVVSIQLGLIRLYLDVYFLRFVHRFSMVNIGFDPFSPSLYPYCIQVFIWKTKCDDMCYFLNCVSFDKKKQIMWFLEQQNRHVSKHCKWSVCAT